LTQASDAGIPVIRGSEMLWEQGVGQFELWTHRTAPYKVMKDVVLSNCLPPPTEDDNEEAVSVVEQQVEAKELSTTSSIK
jgi:pentafunctional AROM polypeptide